MELEETNNPYSNRGPYTNPTTISTIREEDANSDTEAGLPLRSGSRTNSTKSRPRPSSIVVQKRESFAKSVKAIVIEKPPTKDPVGYTTSMLSLCCAIPVAGCGICCFLFLLLLFNFIPIGCIVVGALYFDRDRYCPIENIALLLVIGGSISLVQGVSESIVRAVGFWKARRHGVDNYTTHNHPAIQIMNMILRLASFGWFIAACVIIFRISSDVSFDNASPQYCNPVLYLVAFWLVTVTLIFIGLGFVLLICSCCCVLFVNAE